MPLLREAGIQPDKPQDRFFCTGTLEKTSEYNRLRLKISAKWARIEVSAKVLGGNAGQQVLRCLSNSRGMLEQGHKGATITLKGGRNQVPVIIASKGFDLSQEQIWPEVSLWMIENTSKLMRVFQDAYATGGCTEVDDV